MKRLLFFLSFIALSVGFMVANDTGPPIQKNQLIETPVADVQAQALTYAAVDFIVLNTEIGETFAFFEHFNAICTNIQKNSAYTNAIIDYPLLCFTSDRSYLTPTDNNPLKQTKDYTLLGYSMRSLLNYIFKKGLPNGKPFLFNIKGKIIIA